LSEPLTVTTGARLTLEDRNNSQSKFIALNGDGAAFNPVAQGGFKLNASNNLVTPTPAQTALADSVALKYFGVPTYAGLTAPQKAQVAAAQKLRVTNLGTLFATTKSDTFREVEPTLLLSPSYKFNENVTGYVSFQYGVKAGIAQVLNGESFNARPEKTQAYELGLKSSLLNNTLTLNTDLFLTNIKDYQQQVRVLDDALTALNNALTYSSVTGNAAGVRAYGLEVDAAFTGISHTTLRFSGAYNNAYYTDFKNSAQPVENGYVGAAPYRDVTGENLPGASKFSFNIGGDYRYPVFKDKEFHTSFNTAYYSRANSDVALSSYAWIPAYSITDFSIGIGRRDKKFDTSLLVKNLFNDDTSQVVTWNSYVPAVPRWIGIMFSGEL
jgi:iron complex outermembrane receptor protein